MEEDGCGWTNAGIEEEETRGWGEIDIVMKQMSRSERKQQVANEQMLFSHPPGNALTL